MTDGYTLIFITLAFFSLVGLYWCFCSDEKSIEDREETGGEDIELGPLHEGGNEAGGRNPNDDDIARSEPIQPQSPAVPGPSGVRQPRTNLSGSSSDTLHAVSDEYLPHDSDANQATSVLTIRPRQDRVRAQSDSATQSAVKTSPNLQRLGGSSDPVSSFQGPQSQHHDDSQDSSGYGTHRIDQSVSQIEEEAPQAEGDNYSDDDVFVSTAPTRPI